MAEARLLVRLCPPPDAGEKLTRKIQTYFQSRKRSGGGECKVSMGPEPGTYLVQFDNEQDKKRVESRTDHTLELDARCLKIVIQPGEEDLSKSQFSEQASSGYSSSYSSPSSPSPAPQRFEDHQQAAQDHGDKAREVITKKIFLTVSATLNTSMFTEQQREKITIICPNLKREGNPEINGSEKLTGDFTDIEKAYHYFKDIIAGNDPSHDFLPSESKNGLKDENGLSTEERNEISVPSALYEYFIHTCRDQIKALSERFGVCIRSNNHCNGITSIWFTSDKSSALIERANDDFTRLFQKSVEDLEQEKIPIKNTYTLNNTIMKLNSRFNNLLVKEEGNQLLLRGPKREILAAKDFLAEESKNSQAGKNMKISSELYQYRNGIEVDAVVFKLLEITLRKEIEGIRDKFETTIKMEEYANGQKMLIVFMPTVKTSDMSSHATESFINAFQNASAMLREKLISLKLSESQKKKLNTLIYGKKLEHLHVKLLKKEDKLILLGLPNYFCAAEKYIVDFLVKDTTESKSRTPQFSDLSYQGATGGSGKEYNGRQNNNLSSEGQSRAKTEGDDKDVCPICMDSFKNKEILKKCKHAFCKSCIEEAMVYKPVCPICNVVYGPMTGDQPEGTMTTTNLRCQLPGYQNCGTIEITYDMYSGCQTKNHPNPGKRYSATTRKAYLPDNKEGREILQLLKRAFDQKLIFTVGQSRTTGVEDVITWNDIHHKTSMSGGPTHFGYPDPEYLKRVRSELKAKGIE